MTRAAAIYLDWVVLGLGVLGLVLVLGGAAAIIGYRQAPHRLAARDQAGDRSPAAVRAVLAARLPVSGVEGMRLALEPGRGRTAVPVRSVMTGAVLAMTVVGATLTFGASLTTLVSHPALYGWNFGYALYAVQGWGPVPARWAGPLLARDRLVAATTGVYFATVQVDGQTVPAIAVCHPPGGRPAHPVRTRTRQQPRCRAGPGHPGSAAPAGRRRRDAGRRQLCTSGSGSRARPPCRPSAAC